MNKKLCLTLIGILLSVTQLFSQELTDEEYFEKCYYEAQEGGAEELVNLAVLYEMGKGVTQDSFEAMRLYLKAEKKGSSTAALKLGIYYLSGIVVKKDPNIGFKYLVKAAEAGNAHAMFMIGLEYLKGENLKKSTVMSWAFFDLAVYYGGESVPDGRQYLKKISDASVEKSQIYTEQWKKRFPKK